MYFSTESRLNLNLKFQHQEVESTETCDCVPRKKCQFNSEQFDEYDPVVRNSIPLLVSSHNPWRKMFINDLFPRPIPDINKIKTDL